MVGLVNGEGVQEMEKSGLRDHHSKDWIKQKSSIDAKSMGSFFNFYFISEYSWFTMLCN